MCGKTGRMRGATAMAVAMVGILGLGSAARADLALTPAGVTAGFKLTTFAFNFPSNFGGVGPISTAYTNTGGVLATNYAGGSVLLFPTDADNQDASLITPALGATYGANNPAGLAKAGNAFYLAEQSNGEIVEINTDGSIKQVIVSGLPFVTAIVANPVTGHLYASIPNGTATYEVDPVAKTAAVFNNISFDGLTISTDGKTLYGASNGHILGLDTASANVNAPPVFDSGGISGVDGAALGFGVLDGLLFANTNFGEVWQVNLSTLDKTLIANGGSRGDLVSLDPNGSLILSQTTTLVRLTAPDGGGFGNGTPEPASLAMLGVGAAALLVKRRRA